MFFFSGSLLSFSAEEANGLDEALVKDFALGLLLDVTHQEGEIPEITSEIETGGEEIFIGGQEVIVESDIAPMTEEEQAAVDAAKEAVLNSGVSPKTPEGRLAMMDAMNEAMPERFKGFSQTIKTQDRIFTTEKHTIRTEIDIPETNIQTESFSVAGVDITKDMIGLVLPDQVIEGEFISGPDGVLISNEYAQKEGISVGDKFSLYQNNGTEQYDFIVVGLVEPTLYSNAADIYMQLEELQRISEREDKINIMLVKSADAYSVDEVSKQLDGLFSGAQVTDSSDTADEVTGSLIDAANLTDKFVGITSIIVMIAAFIIISLLTVLSINKRTREIGTLKAIGWSNRVVVRQILMENIVLGVFGATLGIGLGVLSIIILNNFDISFTAEFATSSFESFGAKWLGGGETESVATSFDLEVAYTYSTFLIGSLIAIVASIIAGGVAAFKSSRMRPSEALRNLE